jgi:competence protein ComEC
VVTQPPVTQPVQTEPPVTLPPVTQPPETQPSPHPSGSSFAVHFIDVGQADAALILCDGQSMLIDGGNADDSSLMYSYLSRLGITYLDYVIGTHAHEDHIGGIAGALNYASVGQVFCPVTSYTTRAFDNFVKAVQNRGRSITVPSVGDRFNLGSADCHILGVNSAEDTNESSIVMKITYGNTSFLFTGDAEREAENLILNSGFDIKADVLKVGHHGSASSTSYYWLRQIAPRYAVISVGQGNSYGHPTETVLSRLRDADVTTYRTDLQGDIICTSNGQTVTFQVNRNENTDTFGGIGGNSTQQGGIQSYVLNTNSMKFHYASCSSAQKINRKNRKDYTGSRDDLINQGYSPCGYCHP